MRTDKRIDGKSVQLPNASLIGFGRPVARVGDCILFTDGTREAFGRVLGRTEDGLLVVVTVTRRLNGYCERWVSPQDVSECWDPKDVHSPIDTLQELLSPQFCAPSMRAAWRQCAHDLWSSFAAFMRYMSDRGRPVA